MKASLGRWPEASQAKDAEGDPARVRGAWAVQVRRRSSGEQGRIFTAPRAAWRSRRTFVQAPDLVAPVMGRADGRMVERVSGQLPLEDLQRAHAIGAFPDRASALRLITAVALNVTDVWAARRYLDMSLLKEVSIAKAA